MKLSALIFTLIIGMTNANPLSKIDTYLLEKFNSGDFSGIILVARDGAIIFHKVYGYANYERKIPNILQTIFKIASITKLFTAALIVQLEAQDLLKISDTLDHYIPDYPQAKSITLSHLLSHSSGIITINLLPVYASASKMPSTLEKIIDMFKYEPLEFAPGSQFKYSNSNYLLLSFIIEKVTGKPFALVIQEKILEPLQMRNSYPVGAAPKNESAIGYTKTENGLHPAATLDPSWPLGSGGLCMTAHDLYLFDQALRTNTLLSAQQRETLFTGRIAGKNSYMKHMSHYGYGCEIGVFENHRYIGHPGGMDGFRSQYVSFVDDNSTIIVLSNLEHAPVQDIAFDIAKIVLERNP